MRGFGLKGFIEGFFRFFRDGSPNWGMRVPSGGHQGCFVDSKDLGLVAGWLQKGFVMV